MFELDDNHFLTPYEVIPCTERQFKDFFINNLGVLQKQRQRRWNEYCEFISFIKRHDIRNEFKVWIFGSLVGNYKPPSDIDLVMFFHPDDFANISSSYLCNYIAATSIFNVQCENMFPTPQTDAEHDNIDNFKNHLITKNGTKGAIEITY